MSLRYAKAMRSAPTDAERRLWHHLRARRLCGFKFKRQQPMGTYIVDFICFDRQLVIEVDGGQHAQRQAEDATRTAWLQAQGFRVRRFWNDEVLRDLPAVLDAIRSSLHAGAP